MSFSVDIIVITSIPLYALAYGFWLIPIVVAPPINAISVQELVIITIIISSIIVLIRRGLVYIIFPFRVTFPALVNMILIIYMDNFNISVAIAHVANFFMNCVFF